jgi:hypothetical protein
MRHNYGSLATGPPIAERHRCHFTVSALVNLLPVGALDQQFPGCPKVAERCVVIEAVKVDYRIVWMSQLLDVPRSFYAWRNRVETASRARRRELAVELKAALPVPVRRSVAC